MELSSKNRVFIDTSAFLAFVVQDEPYHQVVVDWFLKCFRDGIEMVTTDYILDELLTFLRCKKKLKMEAILSFLLNAYSSGIKVFGVSEELFGESIGLMTQYKDYYFSCTDCVSFSVMNEMKIREVLTLDKHFVIAGFNSLINKN